MYKPKNVNLKHMPGFRTSQPESAIEDSKASLVTNGKAIPAAKIMTPSKKVLQQSQLNQS
eukprot:CAMPEP_0185576772 /NCGR_PEP_ID=MMETSP0434-20130131/7623_1 /TAXON_ID=626734 ORGANISM="Favella taraikaensis, Strain Fe Narragansett Bay" /NCGR_SAMPLE_ID=MMETSP0434 /ASSEMBLY_ACC=CAM_ASM_000379 /LENGTH=59 /DNA_ID=CAMNT_0028194105 /DNA_START=1650 /DNA_END=1829 /DNA_ORIENTATION=+